jgi:DNA-binding beta-propeller fold protein YncE
MSVPQLKVNAYEYDHTIGMDDFAGRAFRNIVDLALGHDEMIYVLQRGEPVHHNVAVKKCNVAEHWFGDFGSYGSGPGQMVWPASIAIDSQQRLYITDEWNQRISVFNTEGNVLQEWGQEGSGDGQLDRPSGIALDTEENLLVVDARNHRIQKFTREGRFLGQWGNYGTGPGQFNMPWGVALSDSGEVYVTDWRNDRVQKFSPGGEFLLEWGRSGNGEGEFNRPAGIAVDNDGDVYVVDWHNHRVQIFDPEGQYLTQLVGDATMSIWGAQLMEANPMMQEHRRTAKYPDLEKRLFLPRGIKIDRQNRIFVVDSCKGRLQVYRKVVM